MCIFADRIVTKIIPCEYMKEKEKQKTKNRHKKLYRFLFFLLDGMEEKWYDMRMTTYEWD